MQPRVKTINFEPSKALVKWCIYCTDDFDVEGFKVFPDIHTAEEAVKRVVEASKHDREWFLSGNNESIGKLRAKDFEIVPLEPSQEEAMLSLFVYSSDITGFGMGVDLFDFTPETEDDDADDDDE